MQILYKNKNIVLDAKKGITVAELFKDEIEKSNNEIIACKFNNEVKGLNFKITLDGQIELIDITDKDGMRIYQRGLIYVVAKAFHDVYPEALLTINYQLYHSMLCEVDNLEITDEMIARVNKRVKEIVSNNIPIERKDMSREEAIKFYEKEKTLKGKLQLEFKEKNQITLYYCEDYYNYLYGVMPISTGFMKKYEILKYHDGFLIRYPSRKNPHKLKEFIECPKLLETLDEYEDVHKVLKVNTLYKLNEIIRNGKIKKYILLDEALHEKKIAKIADLISEDKNKKVILIAGPSSSGKTTFAKRLEVQLRLNGLKTKTISVDNYFVERKDTPIDENGEYDFESIDAIDRKLLNNDLLKLLDGKEIKVPTFNFHEGTKEYNGNTMKLEEDEILIMEGIHCLNDELTFLIPKDQKFKIYVSALTVLNGDYYNRVSTTDTRLIRRIVRDNQFRGYNALHTLKMWPSVNKGETKNIFAYQEEADTMFNSSLIYELNVLKDYAIPLLKEIGPDVPEFSEAKRIISMLNYFEAISAELIPNNSLLREFIGNSIFDE